MLGKAKIGLEYALHRSGPMSMAPSQLGAFARSDPSRKHANIEFHAQPLSLEAFGQPLHTFPAFTASAANVNRQAGARCTSRAAISRRAGNCPNYLSTEDDRKVAADSLRLTRRIASQAALEKYSRKSTSRARSTNRTLNSRNWRGDIGHHDLPPRGYCPDGQVRRSETLSSIAIFACAASRDFGWWTRA